MHEMMKAVNFFFINKILLFFKSRTPAVFPWIFLLLKLIALNDYKLFFDPVSLPALLSENTGISNQSHEA